MKIVSKALCFVLFLFGFFVLVACDDPNNGSDNGTNNGSNNSTSIIGSWTKTGGHIITFYNTGAITTNNFGTGTYGNGTINLAVPLGNSGTGSYNLSGTKLILSGFVMVGATRFNQLNGEWLKME